MFAGLKQSQGELGMLIQAFIAHSSPITLWPVPSHPSLGPCHIFPQALCLQSVQTSPPQRQTGLLKVRSLMSAWRGGGTWEMFMEGTNSRQREQHVKCSGLKVCV